MKNIEKYKNEIINSTHADLRCCVLSDILYLKCMANCSECKKYVVEWLTEEYKEPVLDNVEREYLSATIKPFRKIIVNVSKHRFNNDLEYIAIRVKSLKEDEEENMCFPAFKIGTMYKGMELDKKYSLKELGL